MNIEQSRRIKSKLAAIGENMNSLSRKTGLPYGSIANNINGYRSNRETQEAIAGFLGCPVEELFSPEDNGSAATRH